MLTIDQSVEGSAVCAACQRTLGSSDGDQYKIRKSALSNSASEESNSDLHYLIADLLVTLDAHAVYKYLIKNADGRYDESVLVWILTPDARVTATNISNQSPGKRIAKVMYKPATEQDEKNEEVEIIKVDQDLLTSLIRALAVHHEIQGSEVMKEWRASFLNRYEPDQAEDLGSESRGVRSFAIEVDH